MYISQRFPPTLQCKWVANLLHYLVKVENPKNVTDFDSILNKLLTCSYPKDRGVFKGGGALGHAPPSDVSQSITYRPNYGNF